MVLYTQHELFKIWNPNSIQSFCNSYNINSSVQLSPKISPSCLVVPQILEHSKQNVLFVDTEKKKKGGATLYLGLQLPMPWVAARAPDHGREWDSAAPRRRVIEEAAASRVLAGGEAGRREARSSQRPLHRKRGHPSAYQLEKSPSVKTHQEKRCCCDLNRVLWNKQTYWGRIWGWPGGPRRKDGRRPARNPISFRCGVEPRRGNLPLIYAGGGASGSWSVLAMDSALKSIPKPGPRTPYVGTKTRFQRAFCFVCTS